MSSASTEAGAMGVVLLLGAGGSAFSGAPNSVSLAVVFGLLAAWAFHISSKASAVEARLNQLGQ